MQFEKRVGFPNPFDFRPLFELVYSETIRSNVGRFATFLGSYSFHRPACHDEKFAPQLRTTS